MSQHFKVPYQHNQFLQCLLTNTLVADVGGVTQMANALPPACATANLAVRDAMFHEHVEGSQNILGTTHVMMCHCCLKIL
jgi:hypothetical protein